MTVASQPEHDFHGFGHYDWCPECRAAKDEAADIDAKHHAAEIEHLVHVAADDIATADSAIGNAITAVADLCSDRVYDVELVEGDGNDLLAELQTAARAVRNAMRIAARRAEKLHADTTQSADTAALDRIQHWLRDPDWGVGMLEDINEVVRSTGRSTDNLPGDVSTWERH